MLYIVSITSFLLLATFLVLTAEKYGVPPMVSDTYYQLSEEDRWLFPVTLAASALLLMPCLLEAKPNAAAFLATAGVIFVAAAPAYRLDTERQVHKAAATLSATGCLLWSLTACPWPTVILAALYAAWMTLHRLRTGRQPEEAWYWAEAACLVDIYATYWIIIS